MIKIEEDKVFEKLNRISGKYIIKSLAGKKPLVIKNEKNRLGEVKRVLNLIQQNEYTIPYPLKTLFTNEYLEMFNQFSQSLYIHETFIKENQHTPFLTFMIKEDFIPVPSFHPILQFKYPESFAVALYLAEINDFTQEYIELDYYAEPTAYRKFNFIYSAVPISIFLTLFSKYDYIYDSLTSPYETIRASIYPSYGYNYLLAYEVKKITRKFKNRKELMQFIKNERKEIKNEYYLEEIYENYLLEELNPCEIEAILTLPRNIISIYTLTGKKPKETVAEIVYETLKNKTDKKILEKLIKDTLETENEFNKIHLAAKKVLEGTLEAPSTITLLEASEKEKAKKLIDMFKNGIKNLEEFKEIKIKNIKKHLFEAAKKLEKVSKEKTENEKWKTLAA